MAREKQFVERWRSGEPGSTEVAGILRLPAPLPLKPPASHPTRPPAPAAAPPLPAQPPPLPPTLTVPAPEAALAAVMRLCMPVTEELQALTQQLDRLEDQQQAAAWPRARTPELHGEGWRPAPPVDGSSSLLSSPDRSPFVSRRRVPGSPRDRHRALQITAAPSGSSLAPAATPPAASPVLSVPYRCNLAAAIAPACEPLAAPAQVRALARCWPDPRDSIALLTAPHPSRPGPEQVEILVRPPAGAAAPPWRHAQEPPRGPIGALRPASCARPHAAAPTPGGPPAAPVCLRRAARCLPPLRPVGCAAATRRSVRGPPRSRRRPRRRRTRCSSRPWRRGQGGSSRPFGSPKGRGAASSAAPSRLKGLGGGRGRLGRPQQC